MPRLFFSLWRHSSKLLQTFQAASPYSPTLYNSIYRLSKYSTSYENKQVWKNLKSCFLESQLTDPSIKDLTKALKAFRSAKVLDSAVAQKVTQVLDSHSLANCTSKDFSYLISELSLHQLPEKLVPKSAYLKAARLNYDAETSITIYYNLKLKFSPPSHFIEFLCSQILNSIKQVDSKRLCMFLAGVSTKKALLETERALLLELYSYSLRNQNTLVTPRSYVSLLHSVAKLNYSQPQLIKYLQENLQRILLFYQSTSDYSTIGTIIANFLRLKHLDHQFLHQSLCSEILNLGTRLGEKSICNIAFYLSQHNVPKDFWTEFSKNFESLEFDNPKAKDLCEVTLANAKHHLKLQGIDFKYKLG